MDYFHNKSKKNVDFSFVHKKGIHRKLQTENKIIFSIMDTFNSLPLFLQGENRELATLGMLPRNKILQNVTSCPEKRRASIPKLKKATPFFPN